MRYYRLVITNPQSGEVIVPQGFSGLLGGASYTSFVNGQSLPGAWNVELDIPIIGSATPQGLGLVRVWGISRAEIGQANQLGAKASGQPGMNISISGGMQKGLPLANPAQAGVLFQGSIVQAFGNWIGVDQTLDLVVMPGTSAGSQVGGIGTLASPKNIVLNWLAGTTLASALKTCLQTAFPNQTVSVNINAGIVRPNDEVGFFPTLEQLSQYALKTSRDIIKTPGYAGVTILPPAQNNQITVFDGSSTSSAPNVKNINFQDIIGQPTWLRGSVVNLKTVMRADLAPGDRIRLPQTVVTTSSSAPSSLVNQSLVFQGDFSVTSGRHVGNFRQPSADSWVSVFDLAPNPTSLQGT